MKKHHIAFLFTNSKEELVMRMHKGEDADTALHGMNHIIDAEHFTIVPKSLRSIFFIPRLLSYDFVFAQDNLLLGYAVSQCAKLFRFKTRWLYLALNSSTLIRRNEHKPFRLFLLKTFWASYARIICISSEQRDDFIRLGISRNRLVFVPFGVDAYFFQPTDRSYDEDLIVSVGRDAGRDYKTLFAAAERMNHAFVVVAGYKNIPSGPVPENVSVRYNRSLSETRELYTRARLVVVPSKDTNIPDGSDCSGQTAILDALAAGKAVIATHRSWIADYFIPGQDLLVVPSNDPEALVQAINELSHDPERRRCLAVSGHAKVVTRYTTKTFAQSLRTLMDDLS